MSAGFHARLLSVDLSTGDIGEQAVPPEWYRTFLGGSGLAARLLYGELTPQLEPLAPEAPLAFVAGLLAGLPCATACKVCVCGKSPLTGIWNEATAGGLWPAALRATGYDGIVVRGAASQPTVLVVEGRQARLEPAGDLWGQDTFATHDALVERHGAKARVASIGPAGEAKVRFASIMMDGRVARAAGRGGMGAVMGSKLLKAVVVRGKTPPEAHDLPGLKALNRGEWPEIRANAKGLRDFGTSGGVEAVEFWGDLPIKNWQLGSFTEGARKTTAQTYFPEVLDRHRACSSCPIRCAKDVHVRQGPHAGDKGHGPEYETLAGFGANCLNDDPHVIIAANDLCNRNGLDTISASGLVAFALEACERGLVGPGDAEGLSLAWGDADSILGLLDQITHRRALGDVLAEGARLAAERLGGNAVEFAVHTKGMEYPLHDPRAFVSMAVHYATTHRGACHLDGLTYFLGRGIPLPDMGYTEPPDPASQDGKAKIAYDLQNFLGLHNPLGLCKFLFLARVGPSGLARWIGYVTGWDVDQAELLRTGERLAQLKRLINVRLGISRKDDTLPPRLASHARPTGRSAGQLPHIGRMLHEYYQLRGWTPEGIPTAETLEAFDLGDLGPAAPLPGA